MKMQDRTMRDQKIQDQQTSRVLNCSTAFSTPAIWSLCTIVPAFPVAHINDYETYEGNYTHTYSETTDSKQHYTDTAQRVSIHACLTTLITLTTKLTIYSLRLRVQMQHNLADCRG